MASPLYVLSSILLFILFHVIEPMCSASIPTRNIQTGFRATLTRVNLPKNRYFLNELIDFPLKSTLNANHDEYTMNLNIGSPPVAFNAVIDTGSDLIWAKCNTNHPSLFSATDSSTISATDSATISERYSSNYKYSSSSSSFSSYSSSSSSVRYSSNYKYKYSYSSSSSSSPQNTSSFLFDPLKSQSFSKVTEPCDSFQLSKDCKMSYVDHTVISFFMGHETLTMVTKGTTSRIHGVTFACGKPEGNRFGYDGVVGMGRGKLSLLSQLQERVFAYCFPSRFGDQSKIGVFLMGSEARNAINGNNMIQTMRLLSNSKQESLYYLSLEGISVGETRLNVTKSDFALTTDGTGGMIIDSGATFTSLENGIVGMIKEEFLIQTKLEKSEAKKPPYDVLDLCFMSPYDVNVIPKIVFHFEGADWELAKENYIYEDKTQSQACLAMVGYGEDKTSVFGNLQQQNMMVIYDLDRNSLSFMPAHCNEL